MILGGVKITVPVPSNGAPAVGADPARFTEPCNADPRPDGEAAASRSQLFDDADDLVSGDDPRMFCFEVTFTYVQIGSAYPARLHPYQDLSIAGTGHLRVDLAQRVRFDPRGIFERHCPHARHTLRREAAAGSAFAEMSARASANLRQMLIANLR